MATRRRTRPDRPARSSTAPSRRRLAEARFCGWTSSGLTGKGGLGPYYLQQFAREQSRTIMGE
jgi:hypothetical protein